MIKNNLGIKLSGLFSVVVLATAIFISNSWAATYYVSSGIGDDTRTLAQAQNPVTPWKTIQKAADEVAGGDTVLVQPGTYDEGGKQINDGVTGSAASNTYAARVLIGDTLDGNNNLITFKANGAPGSVIIKMAGDTDLVGVKPNAGFYIFKADNIRIEGFEIDGSGDVAKDGICLSYAANNCQIINNIVHHLNQNGITIGRCYSGGSGGDVRGDCDFDNVSNNICYMNSITGIFYYASPSADGRNSNMDFNLVYQTQTFSWDKGGLMAYGNWMGKGIFKYCISVQNNCNGAAAFWGDPGRTDTNMEYYSCTFADNRLCGMRFLDHCSLIYNSIICNNPGTEVYMTDTWSRIYKLLGNCIWDNVGLFTAQTGDLGAKYSELGTIPYDPLFRSGLVALSWADSYLLKCKYDPAGVLTGDGDTSPCVDHYYLQGNAGLIPGDLVGEVGAHYLGYIGYPDQPLQADLGPPGSVDSNNWYNTLTPPINSVLVDAVVPSIMENVRFWYQISYEESFGLGGNIVNNNVSLWGANGTVVSVNPAVPSEGQYHWQIYCEDNVKGVSGNVNPLGAWTVANNDAIAFGVDVTTPTIVNDLAGFAIVGASSATLTWNDVDDSLPAFVPATLPPIGYKRMSEVATYNIYRSTFSITEAVVPPWTWDTWKAQVIALNTNQQSKRIIEPRGVGAAGAPHTPYIDGLILGDELIIGQTYYYTMTSVDNAGNESIQGNEISIAGVPIGGGDLEYIYDGFFNMPCWGVVNPLDLDDNSGLGGGTALNIALAPVAATKINNTDTVTHYARLKKAGGACIPEVRFYYTVGTFSTNVQTCADTGNFATANKYFQGVWYDASAELYYNILYEYYKADFPSDIHACGDDAWNVAQPRGVVGVRVAGCQSDKDPTVATNWIFDSNDIAYTYYVLKNFPGGQYNHPGERKNDVRQFPLKHIRNDLLALNPADARNYFMPEGLPVADNLYLDLNKRTVLGAGFDQEWDILFGETPDLYLRFAYNEGSGAANAFSLSYDTGPGWVACDWNVSGSTESVVDNDANNGLVPGGLANNYYGHFGMFKLDHASVAPVIQGLSAAPESGKLEYYFKVKDAGDTEYIYDGGGGNVGVSSVENNARTSPFKYPILQDDLSRPAAMAQPENGQNGLWAVGGGTSWSSGGTYSVRIDIRDTPNSVNDIFGNGPFGNVISGRGGVSGVYGNPGAVAGTTANPVHDTRVYYLFSNVQDDTNATYGANYAQNINITAQECGDAVTTPGVQFVSLTGPGGDGNGLWQGSFTLGTTTTQYIYYRVYACNNDADPQAFVATSTNTFTNVGGAAALNDHGTTGAAVGGLPTDDANRDRDRDHGWIMPARYGGTITGARYIRITSEAELKGTKKVIVTDVSVEDDRVGNIISHEIRNEAP